MGSLIFIDKFDSNIIPINLTMNEDRGYLITTPEIHAGIKFRNPRILHGRLEFGITYLWIFNKASCLQVEEYINDNHLSYRINPNISLLSIDLVYSLFRNTESIKLIE